MEQYCCEKISKVLIQNPQDSKIRIGKMPYAFNLQKNELNKVQNDYKIKVVQQEEIKQNNRNKDQDIQIKNIKQTILLKSLKKNEEFRGEIIKDDVLEQYFVCLYLNQDINKNIQVNIVPLAEQIRFNKTSQYDDNQLKMIDNQLKQQMKPKNQIQTDNIIDLKDLKRKNFFIEDLDNDIYNQKKINKQQKEKKSEIYSNSNYDNSGTEEEDQFKKKILGIDIKDKVKFFQEVDEVTESEQEENNENKEINEEDEDFLNE